MQLLVSYHRHFDHSPQDVLYINKEYFTKTNMSIWPMIAIISFAALLHASFQLSVSVLTVLSGHALGAKRPKAQLISLVGSYVGGIVVTTMLVFSALAYFATLFFSYNQPTLAWILLAGINVAVGGSVLLFYFRKTNGTELWLPRRFAEDLAKRAKGITQPEEAFALGVMSIFIELAFIAAPLSIAVLTLVNLPAWQQVGGLALYVALSSLPILIIASLVGGGHKISTIQRWREQNKRFLQYAAGSGLIVLGLYIFIAEVVGRIALDGSTLL